MKWNNGQGQNEKDRKLHMELFDMINKLFQLYTSENKILI